MAKIGKNYGFPEYGAVRRAAELQDYSALSSNARTKTSIKDDFVIPHVGPEISDDDILAFTEGLAERIVYQPDRAVVAQANQQRQRVVDLVK